MDVLKWRYQWPIHPWFLINPRNAASLFMVKNVKIGLKFDKLYVFDLLMQWLSKFVEYNRIIQSLLSDQPEREIVSKNIF